MPHHRALPSKTLSVSEKRPNSTHRAVMCVAYLQGKGRAVNVDKKALRHAQ
jgi:hypothetical protein